MAEKEFTLKPKYKTKFMDVPMENAPAYEAHRKRSGQQPASHFTATPYHSQTGDVVPGLEEAVRGKRFFTEHPDSMPAVVAEDVEKGTLTLSNGLVRRTFHVPRPGSSLFYTKSFYNEYIETELMADIPKAELLLGLYDAPYRDIYHGMKMTREPTYFSVGGPQAPNALILDSYRVFDCCEKGFDWAANRPYSNPAAAPWPPKGKRVEFLFVAGEEFPSSFSGVQVKAVYELYDDLPVMKKRVEVINAGTGIVTLGRLVVEALGKTEALDELLYLETSYTGGYDGTIPFNTPLPCGCAEEGEDSPLRHLDGTRHACYEVGPAYELKKGEAFRSFEVYELVHSTYWFESRARERLVMYRRLFPWITDNPLTFHSTRPLSKKVIQHAAQAGFELVVQSFGVLDSSRQMLSDRPGVLKKYKRLVEYAHSKGIALGVYQAQYQLEQFKKSPAYGANGLGTWNTWCMASDAFRDYWPRFLRFLMETGMDCVEIDGPYPNCFCDNGERHEHHEGNPYAIHQGYYDSQVKQWENAVRMMTATFRNMGVYVQVPAWYYLNGGNKCGIGYEEIAFSQPRQEQLIYSRQILHNASYARTMSMSWSHIPLGNYQGGGKAAAFRPFYRHKEDYNWVMAQNIGNGITGVFRGRRLFDRETLPVLQKWVRFYKAHRGVVNGDVVHMAQAKWDEANHSRTTELDMLLHTSPENPVEKGLLWVYNQTDKPLTRELLVPVYTTGLTDLPYPPAPVPDSMGRDVCTYGKYPPNYSWLPGEQADYDWPEPTGRFSGTVLTRGESGEEKLLRIDSNGNVRLKITLPPMSFTYYFFCEAQKPD